MNTEKNILVKQMIRILNDGFGEETSIKCLMSSSGQGPELHRIGSVNDFKSQYKNDVFDTIFEDKKGVIIDCRIHEFRPTAEELINYSEYWEELSQAFNKPVSPVFIIHGEKR